MYQASTKYFDENIKERISGIRKLPEVMYVCILCSHLKICQMRDTYACKYTFWYITVSTKRFLFAYFTQITIISELILEPIFTPNCR